MHADWWFALRQLTKRKSLSPTPGSVLKVQCTLWFFDTAFYDQEHLKQPAKANLDSKCPDRFPTSFYSHSHLFARLVRPNTTSPNLIRACSWSLGIFSKQLMDHIGWRTLTGWTPTLAIATGSESPVQAETLQLCMFNDRSLIVDNHW